MATLSNAFDAFEAIGNREDLSDVIYNIAPTHTPFLQSIGRTSATATLHEWQIDDLATAASNTQIEGEDAVATASTATVRRGNRVQLSHKVPAVTGTQEAVIKAGRRSELSYMVAKATAELKRDMEVDLTANALQVTGSTSAARVTAGVESWITTNDVFGATGSSPATADGNAVRTDGTTRVFTEAQLKESLRLCFDSGGEPDCILVGAFNKQKMSGFTGNATRFKTAEDRKLVAAIDLYQSDFGDIQVFPSRFHRQRSALILQKDMWAVAYLRTFRINDLAKTGDHERRQVLVEYGLEARNEASSGGVFDLTIV